MYLLVCNLIGKTYDDYNTIYIVNLYVYIYVVTDFAKTNMYGYYTHNNNTVIFTLLYSLIYRQS